MNSEIKSYWTFITGKSILVIFFFFRILNSFIDFFQIINMLQDESQLFIYCLRFLIPIVLQTLPVNLVEHALDSKLDVSYFYPKMNSLDYLNYKSKYWIYLFSCLLSLILSSSLFLVWWFAAALACSLCNSGKVTLLFKNFFLVFSMNFSRLSASSSVFFSVNFNLFFREALVYTTNQMNSFPYYNLKSVNLLPGLYKCPASIH